MGLEFRKGYGLSGFVDFCGLCSYEFEGSRRLIGRSMVVKGYMAREHENQQKRRK